MNLQANNILTPWMIMKNAPYYLTNWLSLVGQIQFLRPGHLVNVQGVHAGGCRCDAGTGGITDWTNFSVTHCACRRRPPVMSSNHRLAVFHSRLLSGLIHTQGGLLKLCSNVIYRKDSVRRLRYPTWHWCGQSFHTTVFGSRTTSSRRFLSHLSFCGEAFHGWTVGWLRP